MILQEHNEDMITFDKSGDVMVLLFIEQSLSHNYCFFSGLEAVSQQSK